MVEWDALVRCEWSCFGGAVMGPGYRGLGRVTLAKIQNERNKFLAGWPAAECRSISTRVMGPVPRLVVFWRLRLARVSERGGGLVLERVLLGWSGVESSGFDRALMADGPVKLLSIPFYLLPVGISSRTSFL